MTRPAERSRPMFRRLLYEGKVAVIFLTRVPMTADGPITPGDLASSAPFFPLTGAGLGLFSALVFAAAVALGLTPLIGATLAIAALVLVTGALHEDGLADAADGLGGGSERVRRLEIMRDPRTGTFGVLALVLTVLLRIGALAALAEPALVLAASIGTGALSRAPLPAMMRLLPPARPDGLARSAGRPLGPRALGAVLIGVLIAGLTLGPLVAGAALLLTAGTAATTATLAVRRLGGVTGDVLGATQQLSEVLVLLGIAVLAPLVF